MTSHGLGIARGILEKYGWKEGKGLGRHEHGMVTALKPKLKNNTTGLGYSQVEASQFTSFWWEKAYNSAAEDISVSVGERDITVEKMSSACSNSSNAYPQRTCGTQTYDRFLKTSRLTQTGEESLLREIKCPQVEESGCAASTSSSLSDSAIFKACGKRTAHKGARHGLKLSGKLARLARQEEQLSGKYPGLQEVPNCSLPEESVKDGNFHGNEKSSSSKKKEQEEESKKKRARNLPDKSFGSYASSRKAESYSVDENFGSYASSCMAEGERRHKKKKTKNHPKHCSRILYVERTVVEEITVEEITVEEIVTVDKNKSKSKRRESSNM